VREQVKNAGKKITTMRRYRLNQIVRVVVSILLAFTVSVRADSGSVLWQRTIGPITVTAFITERPLRTGPVDLSFLIENSEPTEPILDARVYVTLENETGTTLRAEATHAQARNKLLYCSTMNLVRAGHWKMNLVVTHGSLRAALVNDIEVIEGPSTLKAYWKLLAFPFTIAILFIFHQRLAWKRVLLKPSR
jgi:hypothetical protein